MPGVGSQVHWMREVETYTIRRHEMKGQAALQTVAKANHCRLCRSPLRRKRWRK